MSNPKIIAIAIKSATELAGLIRESEKEILNGMHKAIAEAQLQEGKPKFKIGFTITLDLDADVATYTLGWSTKITRETCSEIPDPNQLDLIGHGDQASTDLAQFIRAEFTRSDTKDATEEAQ